MPRNASDIINDAQKLQLPVLKHFIKIDLCLDENNKCITKSQATAIDAVAAVTPQRKTFENLSNKIVETVDDDDDQLVDLNAIEHLNTTSQLQQHQHEDSTSAKATQTLYPTVFDLTSPEAKAQCSIGGLGQRVPALLKNKTKRAKSFNVKCSVGSSAKENRRLATLRVRKGTKVVAESKAAFRYFDECALNNIETFNCVKAAKGKRKRVAATKPLPTLPISSSQITSAVGTKQQHKRPRIMSLYERRFQTDESARSVVSNGYLSTTRNTVAAATTAAAAISNIEENTDISNQYYMSSSNASATGVAASLANGGVANYAPSMATLCNIGNTCYLNSVVYTLRFAPQFVHNLHHLVLDLANIQQHIGRQRNKSSSLGRNMSGAPIEHARSWSSKDLASFEHYNATAIGHNNNSSRSNTCETQKSSQQLLTEKLHELYQNLHRNEMAESAEPFHADTLLHAIQNVSSIFEGNQQQDAHEFLMCVLNSIRETSQTLIKAIAECPDVIMNGCISGPEQSDSAYGTEKDARSPVSQPQTSSGISSLGTSNITKTSFFMRKSKRKEEAKSTKNQRLQSPLKENAQSAASNSLFYLNTVDLSGGSGGPESSTAHANNSTSNNSTASAISSFSNSGKLQMELTTSGGGGDELDAATTVSTLKEKERLAAKIRQLGLDFFTDDFEGITVSTTKCLSCETITEQKESMIDIAVPVPISGFDNADYVDKCGSFIQNSCITREYFRGENKYRCEQCTGYTEAIRSISYEVLPRLLVIQLSRFSGGMEKINSYIPTSFTLQCFCAKCCELSDSNKLHIYKLYSVITHVGATMSVGHYIAYTCSLDWANEYINCPKDMHRNQPPANGLQRGSSNTSASNSASATSSANSQQSSASAAAAALASSGTNLIKKMKFGRSKASSSGDMSKNVKSLNGVTSSISSSNNSSSSKIITNGIGKLSMNTHCQSLRCCATRFKSAEALSGSSQLSSASSLSSSNGGGGLYISHHSSGELQEEHLQNGHHASSNSSSHSNSYNYPSGYGSTGRGGSKNASVNSACEPIWYMCDDDKIKAMTQREFEELLSPARKITITPYLLFYARIDLQTNSTAAAAAGAAQPTPPKHVTQTVAATSTSSSSSSWSGEALQRSQLDKM